MLSNCEAWALQLPATRSGPLPGSRSAAEGTFCPSGATITSCLSTPSTRSRRGRQRSRQGTGRPPARREAVLDKEEDPAAREGLARALWWTERPAQAIAERTHAYAGYRRRGEDAAAAHVGLWIAHEYQAAFGNSPAAGGWLTRAAGLLEQVPEGADHARLELVRSERAGDPLQAGRHAKAALKIARRLGDPDLEITALGRLGLAEVRVGAVESGMSRSTRQWRQHSEAKLASSDARQLCWP